MPTTTARVDVSGTLRQRIATGLENAGLFLFVIALLPLILALIGAPIAAVAWVVAEIVRRF